MFLFRGSARLCAFVLALSSLFAPRAAMAQFDTATVLGTVVDATGAVIPGATVTLKNAETGITATAVTDTAGNFQFLNVRIGTAYLAGLLKQFGDVAKALAAYNAGEHRVVRWEAERPGIDRDEFVDDIPFPETQNYVKRIIGTAEDYRILYGGAAAAGVRASAR